MQGSSLSRSPREKTMSAQTTAHSAEFQAIIETVETALVQSAADARELAERTGTPLVVRDVQEIESASETKPGKESCERKNSPTV